MLYVPKINEPIWSTLKGFHRQRDLRTAVLQDSLVHVTSALSITIDELLKCNRSYKPGCLLFGDDLSKTMNDSKLQGKILAAISRHDHVFPVSTA